MTVNYEFFDQVDAGRRAHPGQAAAGRASGRSRPAGARLCTLKEMAVQLAGFADDRATARRRRARRRADARRQPAGRAARHRGAGLRPGDPDRRRPTTAPKPTEHRAEAGLATASRPATARLPQKDAVKEAKRDADYQPSQESLAKLTPVLTKRWLSPDAWQLDVYERLDGYTALRKALDGAPRRPDPARQGLRACAAAAAPASPPA